MARGIMKSLKLESSIIDALNRLKQQERGVMEEQERAEEYFEAAKESFEKAKRIKEHADVQAEKDLELILDRRKGLEVATNAEEIIDFETLLAPLELGHGEDAGTSREIARQAVPAKQQSGKREERDERVIRHRKGQSRQVSSRPPVVQTSRMFARNDLLFLKSSRKRGRSASIPSVKTESSRSANEKDDFADWVSVENGNVQIDDARQDDSPMAKARSDSLLSEIAVFRPATPLQPGKRDGEGQATPAGPEPAFDAGSQVDEDEVFPPLLETQPESVGLGDGPSPPSRRNRGPFPDPSSRAGEQVSWSSIVDKSPLPTRRDSTLDSTWATSEGTGLFVSDTRRPRVHLPEGTLIGPGNGNSLPTPQSWSPDPAAAKPQKPKQNRKPKDHGGAQGRASPPPPPTPTPRPKKKRKVGVAKATSRKQLTSNEARSKRPARRRKVMSASTVVE